MPRLLIHYLLPFVLCALPAAGATVVFAAIPPQARADYLARFEHSPLDWIIVALGTSLFATQTILVFRALRWRETDFDSRPDRWLENLSQAAEWFPLLGLIGTVAAILETFGAFKAATNPTPQEIIRQYAPAITATGSGLFMALLNLLPQWVARVGRDLIRTLAGEAPVSLTMARPGEDRS